MVLVLYLAKPKAFGKSKSFLKSMSLLCCRQLVTTHNKFQFCFITFYLKPHCPFSIYQTSCKQVQITETNKYPKQICIVPQIVKKNKTPSIPPNRSQSFPCNSTLCLHACDFVEVFRVAVYICLPRRKEGCQRQQALNPWDNTRNEAMQTTGLLWSNKGYHLWIWNSGNIPLMAMDRYDSDVEDSVFC